MEASRGPAKNDGSVVLNLFCSRQGDAWRLFFWPTWLPRYLHDFLDERGEVYPVEIDFEDLERHMAASRAEYEKRTSQAGGVELTARGRAADALAVWLSSALASGVRPRTGSRP